MRGVALENKECIMAKSVEELVEDWGNEKQKELQA